MSVNKWRKFKPTMSQTLVHFACSFYGLLFEFTFLHSLDMCWKQSKPSNHGSTINQWQKQIKWEVEILYFADDTVLCIQMTWSTEFISHWFDFLSILLERTYFCSYFCSLSLVTVGHTVTRDSEHQWIHKHHSKYPWGKWLNALFTIW